MRVVIFGGSGGLGSQLAQQMSFFEGCGLAYQKIKSVGSKDVDITDSSAVKKFFAENVVDVIINMAAFNTDALIHKTDDEAVKRQIEVNINGTINILKHALPGMRERKLGRIILTSSVLSQSPLAGTAIYSGCKAFVDNITKTCAIENAKYGITCNSLVLGYSDGGLAHRIPKEVLDKIVEKIPLKRLCKIEEIYRAVSFLISTEYATGANLVLSGGI
jgi:NAD(P)-dependent dehydrogenase (short-subunit alcohol dehydrogenase family)